LIESEVFKNLIEILLPVIAKGVDLLPLINNSILFHESVVNDPLCHWHIDIQSGLHRSSILKFNKLVIVYGLLSLSLKANTSSIRSTVKFIEQRCS